MEDSISIKPLTKALYDTYIKVGTSAYNQHYRHLWPKGDSSPYIESSFTRTILDKEDRDPNSVRFLIYCKSDAVGVLKLTQDKAMGEFSHEEAMLLSKIYILKDYAGMGIGKKVLQFVYDFAKNFNKKSIWLETMKKGPALHFYLKNGFKQYSESQVEFPTVLRDESSMWILVKQI